MTGTSTMTDFYAHRFPIEFLLQYKALTPLEPEALKKLVHIERLDIQDYNEAEVRSNIIDPVVSILGYQKGSAFSVDLERKVEVLRKNLHLDYKFSLWEADFWLIEAKRPHHGHNHFGYADLRQALEYGAHPQINAALVVLCDGIKFEVFDREGDLTMPLIHVDRENLTRDFDKLRHLLEPWQVWFFQKRRIVRLIDKVFDREVSFQRVEEFKSLVAMRLNSKRQTVFENFRKTSA